MSITEINKSRLKEILIKSPGTLIREDAIKSALRRINIEPGYYTKFIERARLKQTNYIDLDKFVKAIPTKPPPPGKPKKPQKSPSIRKEPSRSSSRKSPQPSPGKSPQPSPGEEDSLAQQIRDLKGELKEMEDNLNELNRGPLNEKSGAEAQRITGIPALEQRIKAKKRKIERATNRMKRDKLEGGYKKTNRRRKINKRTRRCTKRKF